MLTSILEQRAREEKAGLGILMGKRASRYMVENTVTTEEDLDWAILRHNSR
jgi:hypothetical protein